MLGLTEKPDREVEDQPIIERKSKKKAKKLQMKKPTKESVKKKEEKPKITYVDSSYYPSRVPKKTVPEKNEWV